MSSDPKNSLLALLGSLTQSQSTSVELSQILGKLHKISLLNEGGFPQEELKALKGLVHKKPADRSASEREALDKAFKYLKECGVTRAEFSSWCNATGPALQEAWRKYKATVPLRVVPVEPAGREEKKAAPAVVRAQGMKDNEKGRITCRTRLDTIRVEQLTALAVPAVRDLVVLDASAIPAEKPKPEDVAKVTPSRTVAERIEKTKKIFLGEKFDDRQSARPVDTLAIHESEKVVFAILRRLLTTCTVTEIALLRSRNAHFRFALETVFSRALNAPATSASSAPASTISWLTAEEKKSLEATFELPSSHEEVVEVELPPASAPAAAASASSSSSADGGRATPGSDAGGFYIPPVAETKTVPKPVATDKGAPDRVASPFRPSGN